MKQKKSNHKIIAALLILVTLLAGLLAGMIWFMNTHFFVGGKSYAYKTQDLDLRDREITLKEYEQIRLQLPDCDIRWNIPFQGKLYPDDTTHLSVSALSGTDMEILRYFTKLEAVDAGQCQDWTQLEALKAMYPDLRLTYTVIIGGQTYDQDAQSVATADLTDEDIAMMECLPELVHVDASACRDYAQIGKLTQAHPELNVSYQVELMGQTFTEADSSAEFKNPDVDELLEKLSWLPHMEKVYLEEPKASADVLCQLMNTYPDITFIWDKTVLGETFSSAETEFDLSGLSLSEDYPPRWTLEPISQPDTEKIIRKVRDAMAYFPNAEKVILPAYNFDNETMSAFREEMRPEYKVVWTVYVTKKPVRTDQEVIHSSAYQVCFIDEQSQDLKYCEDAVVVDIGHSYVKNIEWVKGMPKLKYLILTHNWVKDLTPLSTCKNLVYLELFWNDHIPDYTPLLGCTALEDLNISATFADIEPLHQMTWLKNLWANCKGITPAEDAALKESLPNTTVMTTGGSYTTGGWRQVQGYYDMRDIMGLPYNTW